MHREFPVVAFLSAVLLLLPLPWHWRAGNVATLSIIVWLFVSDIIYGVDAIIWGDNVDIVIPVWCDITTKIIIGANFALPAACFCICMHLERVASLRMGRTGHEEKRKRQIFELLMCFGLPMIFMVLHYIVQGHRFDIIEGYGCRPTTYVSIPALFIIWIPPLILSALCLVFAGLALMHFVRRRITFSRHLDNSRSGLTPSRYLRLMAMSIVEMVWGIILTAYTLSFNLPLMRPYTSWAIVHWNFSRIDLYAVLFIPASVLEGDYLIWWMMPASSFIFVAFFAFGEEALREYSAWFKWLRIGATKKAKLVAKFGPGSATKSKDGVAIPISGLPIAHLPSPPPQYNMKATLDNSEYDLSDINHTYVGDFSPADERKKSVVIEDNHSSIYFVPPEFSDSMDDLSVHPSSPASRRGLDMV